MRPPAFSGLLRFWRFCAVRSVATTAELAKLDVAGLAAHFETHLQRKDVARVVLEQQIDGRTILGRSFGKLVTGGMKAGDAGCVTDVVALLRDGGPKTIRISSSSGGSDDSVGATRVHTFESQEELREFLVDVGAFGLNDGSNVSFRRMKQVCAALFRCDVGALG